MDKKRGFILVLLSSLGFGTLGLWGKLGYAAGYTPLSLLTVRFSFASIILWGFCLIKYPTEVKISQRDLVYLLLQGGVFYAISAIGFFYALLFLPASVATILMFLHPVYTFILSPLLFKTKVTRQKAFAMLLAVSGVFLLVMDGGVQGGLSTKGLVIGVLDGVAYSLYSLSNQAFSIKANAVVSTTYTTTFCTTTLLLLLRPGRQLFTSLTPAMWGIGIGIAFIGTVVGILLYVAGIRLIGASEASIVSAFEPLTCTILAVIFLNEKLVWLQIVGIGMVLGGVMLLETVKEKPPESVALENK